MTASSIQADRVIWRDYYEAVRDALGMVRITSPDAPAIRRLQQLADALSAAEQSPEGFRVEIEASGHPYTVPHA